MDDMPNEIYADKFEHGDDTGVHAWKTENSRAKTKYTRSDIHEAEIAKLRDALDVAERLLREISECDLLDCDGEEKPWVVEAREALTTIKQARGKG